jgi:hypothetical protein
VFGMTVPPDAQCYRDECERDAVDPLHPAGSCEEHFPVLDGDNAPEDRPPESDYTDVNPRRDTDTGSRYDIADTWGAVDFSKTTLDTYPSELLNCEQWMGRLAVKKLPFAS